MLLISCLRVTIYVLQPCWMLKQFITLNEMCCLPVYPHSFTDVVVALALAPFILGGKHLKQEWDLSIPIDMFLVSEYEPRAMGSKNRHKATSLLSSFILKSCKLLLIVFCSSVSNSAVLQTLQVPLGPHLIENGDSSNKESIPFMALYIFTAS